MTLAVSAGEWRASIEQRFVFDPDEPHLAADIFDVEEQSQARAAEIVNALEKGPSEQKAFKETIDKQLNLLGDAIKRKELEVAHATEELTAFVSSVGVSGRILSWLS